MQPSKESQPTGECCCTKQSYSLCNPVSYMNLFVFEKKFPILQAGFEPFMSRPFWLQTPDLVLPCEY